jgi:hypothetical protein
MNAITRVWLVGCLALGAVGLERQPSQNLGNFIDVAGFSGLVGLQSFDDGVLVTVAVGNPDAKTPIPVERFDEWMLLPQGNAAARLSAPEKGKRQVTVGSFGGGTSQLWYKFEKVEHPTAVILRIDDQFRVFPIPVVRP